MRIDELAGRLRGRFADVLVARDEVTAIVDRAELIESLRYLRDEADLSFRFLVDVSCTDWPGRAPRIWMAYHLLSMEHGHRIRVKAGLPEEDPAIASAFELYPAAEWQEREVYDLFGVRFDGHPDLRRVFMPDEWVGHPLRKDEPLGGVATHYRGGARIPPVDERGL